jgi:hypothetical protein
MRQSDLCSDAKRYAETTYPVDFERVTSAGKHDDLEKAPVRDEFIVK